MRSQCGTCSHIFWLTGALENRHSSSGSTPSTCLLMSGEGDPGAWSGSEKPFFGSRRCPASRALPSRTSDLAARRRGHWTSVAIQVWDSQARQPAKQHGSVKTEIRASDVIIPCVITALFMHIRRNYTLRCLKSAGKKSMGTCSVHGPAGFSCIVEALISIQIHSFVFVSGRGQARHYHCLFAAQQPRIGCGLAGGKWAEYSKADGSLP